MSDDVTGVGEAGKVLSGWQPIETAPAGDCAVLLFFGRMAFRNIDGANCDLGAVREHAYRAEVAFFQSGRWYESGTGHDVFEEWNEHPTHWMPLPSPPVSA